MYGIAGGLAPYKVANQFFTTQVDAQNNTDWVDPNTSTNSHSYSFIVDEITYWISVKDKTGNILVKSVYISGYCIFETPDNGPGIPGGSGGWNGQFN